MNVGPPGTPSPLAVLQPAVTTGPAPSSCSWSTGRTTTTTAGSTRAATGSTTTATASTDELLPSGSTETLAGRAGRRRNAPSEHALHDPAPAGPDAQCPRDRRCRPTWSIDADDLEQRLLDPGAVAAAGCQPVHGLCRHPAQSRRDGRADHDLFSSPSSFGMAGAFFHFWLAERSDVAAPTRRRQRRLAVSCRSAPSMPMQLGDLEHGTYTGPQLQGRVPHRDASSPGPGRSSINDNVPFDDPRRTPARPVRPTTRPIRSSRPSKGQRRADDHGSSVVSGQWSVASRMRKSRRASRLRRRSGITLTEILIAIMILGVGLVSLATLFPIGLLRLRDATRYSRIEVPARFGGRRRHGARAVQRASRSPYADSLNYHSNRDPPTPWYVTTPNGGQHTARSPRTRPSYGGDWSTRRSTGNVRRSVGANSGNSAAATGCRSPTTRSGGIRPDAAPTTGTPTAITWATRRSRPGSARGSASSAAIRPTAALPSAHGLQRITNFNRPFVITAAARDPDHADRRRRPQHLRLAGGRGLAGAGREPVHDRRCRTAPAVAGPSPVPDLIPDLASRRRDRRARLALFLDVHRLLRSARATGRRSRATS